MARRGATARVNLVKASTGSAAPLITAKTGARQIAAAPLVHAPTPTTQRTNPSLPAPVQVGGEKAAHQGFATQTATVGSVDYALEQDGNNYVLKDAAGNVKRKYSASQMDNIRRRGNSGATMDPLDQAAFFRFSGGKTEREIALEDEQRKAANAAAADRAKQDYAHQLAMEKQAASDKAALERAQATAASRENAAQIKADAAAKEKELARQAHERELGRAGDMTDEDFAEFQRMGGKQYATWGYSPENQAKIDSYEKEWQNMLESGNYSADDLQTMRGEIDARIGNVKKSVNKRTNTPDVDAQPILSQDGRFMWDSSKGANGAWIAAPTDQEKARSDAREARFQERKDKYEQSIIDALMKPKDEIGEDGKATGEQIPGMSYEEALAEARKRSAAFFAQPTAQPTPAPTAQPTPNAAPVPPTDPNDPLSAFSQFRR